MDEVTACPVSRFLGTGISDKESFDKLKLDAEKVNGDDRFGMNLNMEMQGDVKAMFETGMSLLAGRGCEANESEAVKV